MKRDTHLAQADRRLPVMYYSIRVFLAIAALNS